MINACEKWSPISRETVKQATRRRMDWMWTVAEGHQMRSTRALYGHIERGSDEANEIEQSAQARAARSEAAEAAIDAATGRLDWEF
jgi:hypothetical protein